MLPRVFLLVLLKNSKNPTRKFGISASKFCSFSSLVYFSLSLFEFFLKRYFGDQNKLLKLAGRTVKYGALNGLIITHVLLERCNEGFYLIISELNALKIPDQIHRRMHTQLVWLFQAKAFPATFFASALAVAKYQLACQIIKHIIQRKNSISNKEKLDHSGNYLQQNIQAKIWVVDSWANVWTFVVYLHQKSKTELWGVKSSKCSFSTHS